MDITREVALEVCDEVRRRNRRRYLSASRWQCWGCMKFGGKPEKRCMRSDDGWDGCALVNRDLAQGA